MDPLVGLFGPDCLDEETDTLPESLPPEVEEGNIEYKLKLVQPSSSRFEHLVTQMKWRLQEGHGEAIYEIGVEDNGMLAGLTDEEMRASLETLENMASRLGASITLLRDRVIDCDNGGPRKKAAEILVRKVPENQQFIDLRMAVLGNVDAGKSTLLGVLTQGELDNGRGRARLNLFRHLHEIQSGRTSSISHEIMGFNHKGEVVNYSESRTMEEICENSTKLITLIDLAGHHKYLKTTIFGLTGHYPDFAMLVVSANSGVAGTTKEHLGFALALKVPVFVVVTKIDQCSSRQTERTVKQLDKILKGPGCKKISTRVENEDDAVTAAQHFHSESITPIFTVSSVTGRNLELLVKFLNVLSPLPSAREREKSMQEHLEHQVDEVYTVPGVGTVVAGTLSRGTLRTNDKLMIGPSDTGQFWAVQADSVHRNRLPCRLIHAGQAATISIGHFDQFPLRRGMVLLSPDMQPEACYAFEADIYVLYHAASYICKGFQMTVHVGNVCQTAIIRKMDKACLRTNDKAKVVLEFKLRPEYIRVGSRLLFREGRTKGMGEVTRAYACDIPER